MVTPLRAAYASTSSWNSELTCSHWPKSPRWKIFSMPWKLAMSMIDLACSVLPCQSPQISRLVMVVVLVVHVVHVHDLVAAEQGIHHHEEVLHVRGDHDRHELVGGVDDFLLLRPPSQPVPALRLGLLVVVVEHQRPEEDRSTGATSDCEGGGVRSDEGQAEQDHRYEEQEGEENAQPVDPSKDLLDTSHVDSSRFASRADQLSRSLATISVSVYSLNCGSSRRASRTSIRAKAKSSTTLV